LFRTVSAAVWICSLNISLRSEGKKGCQFSISRYSVEGLSKNPV
jgi:hypothetical protein